MQLKYVKGDLASLGKQGQFDVIAHGCNCFCTQTRGLAKHFAKHFQTDHPNVYRLEAEKLRGDIDKLGRIEWRMHKVDVDQMNNQGGTLVVVNCYTQYRYGGNRVNVDYDAVRLCMRKLNHRFKGRRIGLPRIGAGEAKGDWMILERIIKQELVDCDVSIVEYERKRDA